MKNFFTICLFSLFSSLLHSQSTVETHTFHSNALGVDKSYRIYLPDGYDDDTTQQYPVVYFLRLHETEWFNPNWRPSGTTLKDVADNLISTGQIGKMILVGASTGGNSSNPNLTGFGIVNMLRPDLAFDSGIGTGRFEDYFIDDLIPHIDTTFRTIPAQCGRGIDGFSLGGYASTLYGIKHPGIFSSIGNYDGSIMWYRLDNPQTPGTFDDEIWVTQPAYDDFIEPMFDSPRDSNYMMLNSAIDILVAADSATLDSIREISFHMHSSAPGPFGNNPTNQQLADSLAARGIYNTFDELVLSPNSTHSFTWADNHATESLVKHWETFASWTCEPVTSTKQILSSKAFELFQNVPNPVNSTTLIEFTLPVQASLRLNLFDSFGKKVKTLLDGSFQPGTHQVRLNAWDFPQGLYYYQLAVADQIRTMKLIIMR